MSRRERRLWRESSTERSRAITTSNLVRLRELEEQGRRVKALADASAAQSMNRVWQAEALALAAINRRRFA